MEIETTYYQAQAKCIHPLCFSGVRTYLGIVKYTLGTLDELKYFFKGGALKEHQRRCPECRRRIGIKNFSGWRVMGDGHGNEISSEKIKI